MMKRWKEELKKHSPKWSYGPEDEENVRYVLGIKQTGPVCHCEKGPGSMRKDRPYGCNTSACMCKYHKNWGEGNKEWSARYARHEQKRLAIKQSLEENGIGLSSYGKSWIQYNIGEDYFTEKEIDLDMKNKYFLEEYLQGLEASVRSQDSGGVFTHGRRFCVDPGPKLATTDGILSPLSEKMDYIRCASWLIND